MVKKHGLTLVVAVLHKHKTSVEDSLDPREFGLKL